LSTMIFTCNNAIISGGSLSESITLTLYKPFVDQGSFGSAAAPSATVYLYPAYNAPPPSNDGNTIGIAIIAGASAAGFLVLVCVIQGLIFLCSKTRRAARAARRSMQARKSGISTVPDEDYAPPKTLWGMLCGGPPADQPMSTRMSVKSTIDDYRVQSVRVGQASRDSSGARAPSTGGRAQEQLQMVVSSGEVTAAELEVGDESIFVWEKHIDKNSGEVYFFNPKTGVSQWDPPTVRPAKKSGK
jgi:hypothetical protein